MRKTGAKFIKTHYKRLDTRPNRGYYTIAQAAKVWGIGEVYAYHLLMKQGVEYFKAKIVEGKQKLIVIPMSEIWRVSDYLDTVRPFHKRRRRGGTVLGFIMPSQLARSSATDGLKVTILKIRDIVNKKVKSIPGKKPYSVALIMWNIMARAAGGVLDALENGDDVWMDWEYTKVRPPRKRPNRVDSMFPRPLDVPEWAFEQKKADGS